MGLAIGRHPKVDGGLIEHKRGSNWIKISDQGIADALVGIIIRSVSRLYKLQAQASQIQVAHVQDPLLVGGHPHSLHPTPVEVTPALAAQHECRSVAAAAVDVEHAVHAQAPSEQPSPLHLEH
jgi:hypothetical protein